MIYAAASLALLVVMVMVLCRAFLGPTIYDRILAVNMFGTKTILLIAVYGFLTERPEFLDLAIVYTSINFVGVVSVLKFIDRLDKFDQKSERL